MKYSQTIGIAAGVLLIAACFLPWSFIESRQLTVSGLEAAGTNFGKPGLFNIVVGAVCMLLFAIPRIWAKRTNVFLNAINLAWAIRNYIIVSSCMMGECPVKKAGLYVLLVAAIIMQAMALFPRMDVQKKK